MIQRTVKRPIILCVPEEFRRIVNEYGITKQTLYAILSFGNNSSKARKARADALDHGAVLTVEEVII